MEIVSAEVLDTETIRLTLRDSDNRIVYCNVLGSVWTREPVNA